MFEIEYRNVEAQMNSIQALLGLHIQVGHWTSKVGKLRGGTVEAMTINDADFKGEKTKATEGGKAYKNAGNGVCRVCSFRVRGSKRTQAVDSCHPAMDGHHVVHRILSQNRNRR